MNEETITPSPTKNYIQSEPVFIADKDGNAHILRSADFWENPSEGGNK